MNRGVVGATGVDPNAIPIVESRTGTFMILSVAFQLISLAAMRNPDTLLRTGVAMVLTVAMLPLLAILRMPGRTG